MTLREKKEKMMTKSRIKSIVCYRENLLKLILAVLLYIICSYHYESAVMPILLDDEYGYWANSSYFLGLDWSSITQNIAYYSYGYSFILLLVRIIGSWFGITYWADLYQIALNVNFLMIVMSFLIAVVICKRYMPNLNWITRNIVCFVVMLYPANQVYSHTTLTECTLTFLFWVLLYIMMRVTDKPGVINHIALAVISLYMYIIHQRTLAVLITSVIVVVLIKAFKISNLKQTAVFGGVLCAGLIIANIIKQNLQNTLYMGNQPLGISELMTSIISKKTLFMIFAVLAMLFALYLLDKGKARLLIFLVVVTIACIIGFIIKTGFGNIADEAVPDRIAMNDFAGQWSKIIGIFSVGGLIRLGTSIVGKWFYLAAGSGLVICWGMRNLLINAFWMFADGVVKCVKIVIGKTPDTLKRISEDLPAHIWFAGVFLAWIGTFMICAIYKEGLYKVDDLVHGRYIEFTIGILLIYSVNVLLSDKHWIITFVISLVLYIIAGEYCQYVYDELKRTHFELAHAVMFGRIFWNYESPTGKIHELAKYVIPLSGAFLMVFKLFGNKIALSNISDNTKIRVCTVRCIIAMIIPMMAWTHLSQAIIDNYVSSRNVKQSGALPHIVSKIGLISIDEAVYFINDSLSYKQASLLQFMLTDREVRFVSMEDMTFQEDAIYIVNNAYLNDVRILESCETVMTAGSYALIINREQKLMERWRRYKEYITD